jgi:hypothetical protein
MQNRKSEATWNPNEKAAWTYFKMVTAILLGNAQAENYGHSLREIPDGFTKWSVICP